MHPTDFGNLAALEHASGGLTFPTLQNDPPSLMGPPGVRRREPAHPRRQLHSDSGQIGYKLFSRVDGKPLLPAAVTAPPATPPATRPRLR
jgi:hypothetical protein